ncbi:MAG: hypothetical protein MI748_18100 [Opitutales bacterium]|nr:hypothetical protein [Opitutales bacterium]
MNRIKNVLQRFPALYLNLLKIKRRNHWSKEWIVTKESDITIEGYQRSANSYFLDAFQVLQNRKLKIATHVHAPSQIQVSVRLGVPTVVMIRHPLDATKSLKALECQCNPNKMEQLLEIPLHRYLKNYTLFYQNIAPIKNRFVIAHFKEVVETIQPTIDRTNAMFGTEFVSRDLTKEEKEKVFETGGTHLSPNVDRDKIKATIALEAESHETQEALSRAVEIYHSFAD